MAPKRLCDLKVNELEHVLSLINGNDVFCEKIDITCQNCLDYTHTQRVLRTADMTYPDAVIKAIDTSVDEGVFQYGMFDNLYCRRCYAEYSARSRYSKFLSKCSRAKETLWDYVKYMFSH